ncbi:translocation/assembly module TamB [Marinobacter halophilus]|uniref:Translocation/assembly module TamB n=1 Tax=Marinobacter halophilus TaxID=1323740 RepID=A0A2T1KA78_9GAMM|nr:translocation/assembly module TamB [Marinobacter halophilus]
MILLAVVLLLPLVLIGLILAALHTETGTAWTIDQVPGLQTESGQGSLLGQWRAERLIWQGYGVGVVVEAPEVDWSPTCLFEKTLCLDTLKADRIAVTIQPSDGDDETGSDISLPRVNLPIAVVVGDVALGPLTVNGSAIWDRFELRSRASGSSLNLEHVLFQLDDIRATATGRTDMRGDWPLDIDVDIWLPPPSGDDWHLTVNLGGSARDLRLRGNSDGYLDAQIQGEVQPLDSRLPATIRLESSRFLAHPVLPETLTLQDWTLSLDGSLANGFRTTTRAMLPGTQGDIEASVRGLVTTERVTGLVLSMTGPEQQPNTTRGTLEVQGMASWADGLAADVNLSLERFPWYSLMPGLDSPPVSLERLQGQASYQDERYQADLEAAVAGPLGEAELSARLDGNSQAVRITQLDMTTGAGSLSGEAELDFTTELAWTAALVLDQFNPGYWAPMLEASLNGRVNSEGQLQAEGLPRMTADWDLRGQWQDQDALARGEVTSDGSDWAVANLVLAIGENRVEGEGRYGSELAGELSVLLPDPGIFVTGLAGELTAELQFGGTVQDPTADLTLNGRGLAWQELLQIETVDLQANLASGGGIDAVLAVQDIRAAEQQLEAVTLRLDGTRDDHELSVSANHSEATVLMVFAGQLADGWNAWQGALTEGAIDVPGPGQTWRLESPANLSYNENGAVSFGAHCWRWQDSSVCAGDQQLWPDTRVAYQMRQFPTAALEPLFPETFRWNAYLDADVDLSLTDSGPDGRITLDAGSGTFEFLVIDDWESLAHESLTLDARLKPDIAEFSVSLRGPELGTFTTELSVDPVAEDRTVQGSFSLQSLDLAFASAFAGLEEVSGQVNGEGVLSGPLLRPQVNGELALTGGRFYDPGLPLPMNDVVLVLEFLGESADISGRWKSNDRSSGKLSGRLSWQQEPELELSITGNRLPVNFEPYARVEIGPDLIIAFREGELSVSGRVDVPRGNIEIKGLPESAVSISEDEVIVGVEVEEPVIRRMLMDVTVVVGEDEVTFDAFGVTGNLQGTLRIGNNMDTRGSLQLVNGQYQAFGQELELRRARIIFVGVLTEPYLDIEAVRRVNSVVAGIRLSGPASMPETKVFSEPSMPQADALSYVILGRPPQGRGDDGQMSQAALSLGLTQASKLTQGIGDELGIRNLTLEAEGSGDGAAVVASGYITDELSLRYGVGIFEPITTVALRYDLGRYFYLEAASGLASSLDIFYTRDF